MKLGLIGYFESEYPGSRAGIAPCATANNVYSPSARPKWRKRQVHVVAPVSDIAPSQDLPVAENRLQSL